MQDETMAVEISVSNTVHVRKQMDSSSTSIHNFNLLQIHLPALQHYIPRMPPALLLDVHYRLKKLKPSAYPHQLFQIYGF